MKERGILFSAPMVRALLAGTKTQTRRVVKPQPPAAVSAVYLPHAHEPNNWHGYAERSGLIHWYGRCPYGQPGDRLWVRETCRAHELSDKEAREDKYGVMERLELEVPPYGLDGVLYEADNAFREIENSIKASDRWAQLSVYGGRKCARVPAIHMPRWASRITLEITAVRVERLQDISRADAIAEGCDNDPRIERGEVEGCLHDPRDLYCLLWEAINGPGSWDANPWVWVLEFKRVTP